MEYDPTSRSHLTTHWRRKVEGKRTATAADGHFLILLIPTVLSQTLGSISSLLPPIESGGSKLRAHRKERERERRQQSFLV